MTIVVIAVLLSLMAPIITFAFFAAFVDDELRNLNRQLGLLHSDLQALTEYLHDDEGVTRR